MWFDPAVVEAVRDLVPTWLGVVIVVLSYLGSVYLIAPAMIAAYWYRRDLVAPWLGGIVGYYGLMSITKSYHTLTRPNEVDPPVTAAPFPDWFVPWYEHAAHISTTSFPSGHAIAATVIVGMLVMELPRSTLPRRALVGALVVGWVGFTRVALAVHFPGDIAGGIAYGLAFLAIFYGVRHLASSRWNLDSTTVAFAVGLAFGLVALAYVGSRNSHIVFGAGVGGLLTWQYAPRLAAAITDSVLEYVLPVVAVVLVVATWFVTDLGIGNEPFLVGWSALFLAAVVMVPWIVDVDALWPRLKARLTGNREPA